MFLQFGVYAQREMTITLFVIATCLCRDDKWKSYNQVNLNEVSLFTCTNRLQRKISPQKLYYRASAFETNTSFIILL